LRGKLWSGSSISIQWKIPNGKVLAHLGIKSKVLHRALNDISAWVGYCISSPQQSIKCQLWYFNLFFQLISRGRSPREIWILRVSKASIVYYAEFTHTTHVF
jgi:hypothetical protein